MKEKLKFSMEYSNPTTTPEGYFDVDARVFRAGTYDFGNGDSRTFTERQVEKSSHSIQGKTISVKHRFTNSSNAKEIIKGSVLRYWFDASVTPPFLCARIRFYDEEVIERLKETGSRAISAGVTTYTDTEGEELIEFNHIAVLLDARPKIPEAQLLFSENIILEPKKQKKRSKFMARRRSQLKFDESSEISEEMKDLEVAIEEIDEISNEIESDPLKSELQSVIEKIQMLLQSILDKQDAGLETKEEEIMYSFQAGKDGIHPKFQDNVKNLQAIKEAEKSFFREKAKSLGFSEDVSPEFIRGALEVQKKIKNPKEIKENLGFSYGDTVGKDIKTEPPRFRRISMGGIQ